MDKEKQRERILERFGKVGITKDSYDILRKEKKKQKKSMMMIVDNLIREKYASEIQRDD